MCQLIYIYRVFAILFFSWYLYSLHSAENISILPLLFVFWLCSSSYSIVHPSLDVFSWSGKKLAHLNSYMVQLPSTFRGLHVNFLQLPRMYLSRIQFPLKIVWIIVWIIHLRNSVGECGADIFKTNTNHNALLRIIHRQLDEGRKLWCYSSVRWIYILCVLFFFYPENLPDSSPMQFGFFPRTTPI